MARTEDGCVLSNRFEEKQAIDHVLRDRLIPARLTAWSRLPFFYKIMLAQYKDIPEGICLTMKTFSNPVEALCLVSEWSSLGYCVMC